MQQKKRDTIEGSILRLLDNKVEIKISDVAQATGLSSSNESDRKAIRRALQVLMKQGVLEAKGAARARVYFLKKEELVTNLEHIHLLESSFQNIPLSSQSKWLLNYVAKPVHVRTPVGYQQEFLRTYKPNQTWYLSEAERAELLTIGNAENIVHPAGTYARKILDRLLIDLSWNSSRLEGNTYSLLETKRLIELGENAAGKEIADAYMILNHKSAIEYIVESAHEKKITSHQVRSIHAILSDNLLDDPMNSGRIRQIAVGISDSTYLPLDNPHLLTECFELFIKKLNQIQDPFEQSFFSLVHLSYLQAFEDVNKRTARMVANIPLIQQNLKPLSFTDIVRDAYAKSLFAIYEKNDVSLFRDLYLWAYRRSAQKYSAIQQSMGEQNVFRLKYRSIIKDIIRTIILVKIPGDQVASSLHYLISSLEIPKEDRMPLLQAIETEIVSLHDGNIARFQIRPSEFKKWLEA